MNLHMQSLKSAWQITKKNKWLWLFGFFSLVFFGGGEFNWVFQFYKLNNEIAKSVMERNFSSYQVVESFSKISWVNVLILIIFIALITIIQGGLLSALLKRIKEKEIKFIETIKTGWQILPRFLSIHILNLSVLYILALTFLILSHQLFKDDLNQISFLVLGISLVVMPLSILMSLAKRFALFFQAEDKDLNIFKCYLLGWRLFYKNWLDTFKASIISLIFLVISSALIAIPAAVIARLIIFIFVRSSITSAGVFNFFGIFVLLVTIVITVFVSAVFGTFYHAYWANVFDKIKLKK